MAYDYSQAKSVYQPTPVAIGPVPTPNPPSTVNYTPQYSGQTMSPTYNPTPYTQTPAGQQALSSQPQPSPSTPSTPSYPISSNPSTDSGFDMKYYPGWDMTAALADWRATGGSKGKTNISTGGNKAISTKGDSRAPAILNDPTANQDFQNSGLNMDEYLSTIDQQANNQNNYLNTQEQNVRADQVGIEQGLNSQADLLRNKTISGKEDALSAARRLYSELQQGYKQRFGGASSAGEAAMALTGNEQQRQMAQTNRQAQETLAQIDQQAAQALQTAQSEFRSRLDQINSNRTMVESQRLQARQSVLQDLANKAYAIKQQQDTFKQNVALMQAQRDMQAKANNSAYNLNPTSTLTTNNSPAIASGNRGIQTIQNSINNISSGIQKSSDPFSNGVYPIASYNGMTRYSDGSLR